MTLLYLVAAWAAGVFIASRATPAVGQWLIVAGAALLLAFGVRRQRERRLAAICLALFALGAGRYAWADRPLPANHIAHFAGTGYATITGLIVQDADVRDHYVNIRIRAERIRENDTEHAVQGIALVQAPRYGDYTYGDRVRVSGQLLVPPEFDDFSYRDYLARQGVHAIVPDAKVDRLAQDQGRPWFAAMYELKATAQRAIDRMLPSPQAPLLAGILIGVDSEIAPEVRDAFNRTGTAHIIAISGANIIIVTRVLMGLLMPLLGTRRASWLTFAGVAAYVVMVGASGAVVRAAIMGSLALFAAQVGRRTYGLTSLAFCIWLMSAWNPYILWDIGFQLSVAATVGLVLLSDPLTHVLNRLLQRGFTRSTAQQIARWLAEPFVVSLAAQITTTPLILIYFDRLSLIALAANLLIVPVQPIIMTGGWAAVFLGMLAPPLGEIAGWFIWLPLTYTLEVVRHMGTLDWASIDVGVSAEQTWAFYGLLLGGAWIALQHPHDRASLLRRLQRRAITLALMIGGVAIAALIWIAALSQPDGRLHVWFIDVGHGHAVLIQTPDGAQILIDGGPNPTRLRSGVGDILPFWDRNIDLVIVTHPKNSAIAALPELWEHYHMSQVLTTGQRLETDNFRRLDELWDQQNINVLQVTAGYRVRISDGVELEILHPQYTPGVETEPEDASMILRLRYGSASFLLTSELSDEAERDALQAGWYLGSTVLELPDFGSESANPPFFLETVRPQIAVVSVDAGNRSLLPDPQIEASIRDKTGHPLYRTDENGTIEMVTDGTRLWVYTEN